MSQQSHPIGNSGSGPEGTLNADAVYAKVSWHLLPLLLICYVIAFLDRINIGYAQLQMRETLTFSAEAYALGAGVFFIGYLLFEVPSNLMLEKIGVRKTLLRIMFCWGIVASAMMFVQTPLQFYVLRFLLGAFEAGFFPGIILYFTYWYPSARRGQVIAIFMTAATIGGMVAGPVSGAILKYFDGFGGYHGWQWLFVLQGLPASVLGIIVYFYLKDAPEQADWLSTAEKRFLRDNLDNDQTAVQGHHHGSFVQMLGDPKVYLLALAYFFLLGATYTVVFTLPSLIRQWDVKDLFLLGVLAATPQVAAIGGMVMVGRRSDHHRERRWHYAFSTTLAAIGLGIVTVVQGTSLGQIVGSVVGLTIAYIGLTSATPLFFTLTSEYLSKAAAAGGIALISSLGNLGPAVTPYINAKINSITGSSTYGLYLVMAMYLISALIILTVVKAAVRHHPSAVPAAAGGA